MTEEEKAPGVLGDVVSELGAKIVDETKSEDKKEQENGDSAEKDAVNESKEPEKDDKDGKQSGNGEENVMAQVVNKMQLDQGEMNAGESAKDDPKHPESLENEEKGDASSVEKEVSHNKEAVANEKEDSHGQAQVEKEESSPSVVTKEETKEKPEQNESEKEEVNEKEQSEKKEQKSESSKEEKESDKEEQKNDSDPEKRKNETDKEENQEQPEKEELKKASEKETESDKEQVQSEKEELKNASDKEKSRDHSEKEELKNETEKDEKEKESDKEEQKEPSEKEEGIEKEDSDKQTNEDSQEGITIKEESEDATPEPKPSDSHKKSSDSDSETPPETPTKSNAPEVDEQKEEMRTPSNRQSHAVTAPQKELRTTPRRPRTMSVDKPSAKTQPRKKVTTGKRRRTEVRKHDNEIVEYSYSYSYSESDPETEHSVRPPEGHRDTLSNTARLHQLQVAEKMKNMSEEMKKLRDRALNLEPIDGHEDSVYEELREILVEERRQQASKNKLQESEELTAAINHVEETQTWQKKMNLQAEAYRDYEHQAKQLQDRTDSFDMETKLELEQLKNKLKAQRQRMIEHHERELEQHSKRWTSDAKTRQYSHATNKLVFLRKQFKLLMTQCRFREANEVKAIMERTERAEEAEAYKNLQHDFDQSLAKLQQKHRDELLFFDEQVKIKIKQLEQQRARLRVAYLNKKKRMDQLEKKVLDADKLWNLQKLERTEELSSGTMRGSLGMRTTKLSLSDIRARSDKDENLISLPPLNTRRNPKTAR